MKLSLFALLALGLALPGTALADSTPAPTGVPATDPFSYSNLEITQLGIRSDYFDDRSSGPGVLLSYDTADDVYFFGQWNHLKFDRLPGSHNLYGVGIGAHQAYSQETSFYIDAAFLKDQLSGSMGSGVDDYWRVTYGFRNHATDLLELDGAIFTERSTEFGRRPFGERLGLDFSVISLLGAVEHTADGNRTEIILSWSYR